MAYVDQVTNRQGQAAGSQGIDLRKRNNRGLAAGVDATASYLRSPEWQEFSNPEQTAMTAGTDSIFAGARSAQRAAALDASRLGLGRGAATQFRTDIQRQASSAVAQQLQAAMQQGQMRRAQGAASLMDAIKEYQQAAALRRMQHRNNSMTSLFQGNFAAGFGALPAQGIGAVAGGVGAGLARRIGRYGEDTEQQ